MEGRCGPWVRIAHRRGQQTLHVLATRRRRSDERARRGDWEGHVANGISRYVHDAFGCREARNGTEVDTDLCWRAALFNWYDRRRDGIRRQHRQTTLAEAG